MENDLTPNQRPWAYIVAELEPDLWDKFVAACNKEQEDGNS